jgi:hypothetical protein
MLKNHFRIILSLALLACAPLAMALDEMSASAEGRGAIAIRGQSLAVSRAEVSLIPGGRFIVSLHGEQRYAFRGEWQDQGSRILLTIQEAQGAAAEGSGELRLRGNRFRTIQISGANNAFNASFAVTGAYRDFTAGATTSDVIQAPAAPGVIASKPATPQPGVTAPVPPAAPAAGVNPPKITVQGSGSFVQGRNDRKKVDAMEVFLEPDGQVNLKTFGEGGETIFTGTWRDGGKPNGQQRFELVINAGGGAAIAGRGFVLVGADGHIDQVSVQGGSRVFRSGYSLDFRQK